MIGAWLDIAVQAPIAFVVGVIVGFVVSSRYRITKRNGDLDPQDPAQHPRQP